MTKKSTADEIEKELQVQIHGLEAPVRVFELEDFKNMAKSRGQLELTDPQPASQGY